MVIFAEPDNIYIDYFRPDANGSAFLCTPYLAREHGGIGAYHDQLPGTRMREPALSDNRTLANTRKSLSVC